MQSENLFGENGEKAANKGKAPLGLQTAGAANHRRKTVSIIDGELGGHNFLRAYIEDSAWLKLGHWCRDGEDSVRTIALSSSDVVLLECSLPGTSGIEYARLLKKMRPGVAIVMLARQAELSGCIRCFQSGADGYFVTPGTRELFEETISGALEGWKPVPREIMKLLIERIICGNLFDGPSQKLSRCERQIMTFIAVGCIDKEIAAATGKEMGTVHSITSNIYKKLKVHRRDDAVNICFGFSGNHGRHEESTTAARKLRV